MFDDRLHDLRHPIEYLHIGGRERFDVERSIRSPVCFQYIVEDPLIPIPSTTFLASTPTTDQLSGPGIAVQKQRPREEFSVSVIDGKIPLERCCELRIASDSGVGIEIEQVLAVRLQKHFVQKYRFPTTIQDPAPPIGVFLDAMGKVPMREIGLQMEDFFLIRGGFGVKGDDQKLSCLGCHDSFEVVLWMLRGERHLSMTLSEDRPTMVSGRIGRKLDLILCKLLARKWLQRKMPASICRSEWFRRQQGAPCVLFCQLPQQGMVVLGNILMEMLLPPVIVDSL